MASFSTEKIKEGFSCADWGIPQEKFFSDYCYVPELELFVV